MMQLRLLKDGELTREGDFFTRSGVEDVEPVYPPYDNAYQGFYGFTYYRRRAILVLGHGGHGKGELCKLLTELYGAECLSSSRAALPHIFPALNEISLEWVGEPFASPEHAYARRGLARGVWKQLISLLNTPDKTTLSREILSRADVYDGMRCAEEFAASRHLFEYVVWVDAAARVGTVDPTLTISRDVADLVIDNNGTLEDLRGAAVRLGERLGVA